MYLHVRDDGCRAAVCVCVCVCVCVHVSLPLHVPLSTIETGGNEVNPSHEPRTNSGGIVAEMQVYSHWVAYGWEGRGRLW